MSDLDGDGWRTDANLYPVLLWDELHVDVLLTMGVEVERYTGPTLLTYEEWWKWESKRLRDGKGPSKRRIQKYCTSCRHDIPCTHSREAYWQNAAVPDSIVDRVVISYERG